MQENLSPRCDEIAERDVTLTILYVGPICPAPLDEKVGEKNRTSNVKKN